MSNIIAPRRSLILPRRFRQQQGGFIMNPFAYQAGGPVTLESLIAAESPVLWLKLDETSGSTAYDSSGNGRHCTISGCTFDSNGVIFSANSSTISRTDANLRIGADNSWCMSSIVTVTSTSGGSGIRNLMTYWHDEYGGSQNCTLYLTNGRIARGGYYASGATRYAAAAAAFAVNDTRMLHIARRPSGLYIYENGSLIGSNTTNNTLTAVTGSQEFKMGGGSYPSSYGFIGRQRHAVMYDNGLSDAKILAQAQAAGLA